MSARVAALAAILALAACFAFVPGAFARRANIVLVLTDDQRAETLWAMPAVQRSLVRHGVTFERAFVVNPLCCPSRASILTGRYSHSTGIYHNSPPFGGFTSFRDGSTIATWLHAAGYRTAYVGKYLNGYAGLGGAYVPPGWDRWVAFSSLGYYRYGLSVDGSYEPRRAHAVYSTDLLGARAASFVRATRAPFFLVFAPFAPHHPAVPARRHRTAFRGLAPWRPPSYNEADVSDKPAWVRRRPLLGRAARAQIDGLRRRQLRTLLAVDQAVGRIVRALRETGRLRNTIIVFTSDNGFGWGEHRRAAKFYAYEESIRVPLVIRFDRLVGRPRTSSALVANIDFAPTFAALGRVASPRAEGRNLLSLLAASRAPSRSSLLVEHVRGDGYDTPTYCALRGTRFKYVVYRTREQELYDLAADPYELENRARDPGLRETRVALRARLARLCDPPPPGFDRTLLCRFGTSRRDVMRGTRLEDVLCGVGGHDLITGARGRDFLYGGTGNDRIVGGAGADVIACGAGRDTVLADRSDRLAGDCKSVRR